ncbi:hypothetical protein ACPCCA_04080 [Streptomyces rimosus]|nr:hypothetical protein [Streptomyces rimosus]MYT47619.1 hypothetical protein [Streptomyces sp. SID5471]
MAGAANTAARPCAGPHRRRSGTWPFDAHGFPWTAKDAVTVPLKADPNA